jgi:succinate dehydrogenase/fumarate reductase cytochrome b subunit
MALKQTHTIPNQPGVIGWGFARRYKLERNLYTLHHLTGLILLLFILLHLVSIVIFRIQGQNVFAGVIIMFQNTWWRVFAIIAMAALVFHAPNGIRLALQQLGFTLGKPTPPIYPYSDALRCNRAVMFVIIAVAVVFAFALLLDFFAGGF